MTSRRALMLEVLALAAASNFAHALTVGDASPGVTLPTPSGAPAALLDKNAKLTYVDFWASWCGPCRQSFPWLNRMHAQYASKGLRIVGVNLDATRSDADKFLAEFPAQFNVMFDPQGKSGKAFGLRGMPSAVLVGADGRIVATHQGFRPGDAEELEARIRTELAKP